MKVTLKECFDSRAYGQQYYPLWRKPLSSISFYLLYFLVNFLRIESPYIISLATITFGLYGAGMLFVGEYFVGGLFLLISYVFDLLDGKLARLKNIQNINSRFLDWIYHSFVPAFAFLGLGYSYTKSEGDLLFLLIGGIIAILFLHKMFLSFLFLSVEKDILIAKGEYKQSVDYEKDIEDDYGKHLKNRFVFHAYFYVLKLFVDSTDILFGLVLFLSLGFGELFLYITLTINLGLWFFSVYTKFFYLYHLEANHIHR